jgi:hypothetical protein
MPVTSPYTMNPHPILTVTFLHVTLVVELGLAPLHHLLELPQFENKHPVFVLAGKLVLVLSPTLWAWICKTESDCGLFPTICLELNSNNLMGTGCVTLNGCPKDEKRKEDGKLG